VQKSGQDLINAKREATLNFGLKQV